MENIFIEFLTQNYYFNTLKLDLNPILTTNANGEYI
jgi:hypothetical protein